MSFSNTINHDCIINPFQSMYHLYIDMEMLESREKKLLYVGMTRATEKLFITSDGIPSKFIKDIDYKYFKIKVNCAMRRISSISIEDYLFREEYS